MFLQTFYVTFYAIKTALSFIKCRPMSIALKQEKIVIVAYGIARLEHLHGVLWLRQLRRIRRTLDAESAATLVHAFVASRVDYCNTVLAGAPKFLTDKLQRVLNAAARVVSNTRKVRPRTVRVTA